MTQDAREPLSSYEKALWRLASYETCQRYTEGQLDLAVQIVADVFWLSDAKIRHDLLKITRDLRSSAAPARARREFSRAVGAI